MQQLRWQEVFLVGGPLASCHNRSDTLFLAGGPLASCRIRTESERRTEAEGTPVRKAAIKQVAVASSLPLRAGVRASIKLEATARLCGNTTSARCCLHNRCSLRIDVTPSYRVDADFSLHGRVASFCVVTTSLWLTSSSSLMILRKATRLCRS